MKSNILQIFGLNILIINNIKTMFWLNYFIQGMISNYIQFFPEEKKD